MTHPVHRHPDADSLARDAVGRFTRAAREDVAKRGEFLALLPGGRSPRHLFELLGGEPCRSRIPWGRLHLFLTDERCLPPENFESNEHLIRGTLLNAVTEAVHSFHPPPGAGADAVGRAALWEGELREFFRSRPRRWGMPLFDLAVVGMGDDGHTAGLFPGDPALSEESAWAAAVPLPRGDPRVPRITLTLPVLAAARRVWVYAPGGEKRELAERILAGDPRAASLPVALLAERRRVRWFVTET